VPRAAEHRGRLLDAQQAVRGDAGVADSIDVHRRIAASTYGSGRILASALVRGGHLGSGLDHGSNRLRDLDILAEGR